MIPDFVRHNLADWITGLLMVALIYMLVRPDSPAADFVSVFSGALTEVVKAATSIGGSTGD